MCGEEETGRLTLVCVCVCVCDGCEVVQRGRQRGQDKESSVFGDEGACVRIRVLGEDCSHYERACVKEG